MCISQHGVPNKICPNMAELKQYELVKIRVHVTGTGAECFELDLGPWSVLGNRALSVDDYVPDFDAVAQPPCRMLRIRRAAYRAALEACTLDPVLGYQVGAQAQVAHCAATGGCSMN